MYTKLSVKECTELHVRHTAMSVSTQIGTEGKASLASSSNLRMSTPLVFYFLPAHPSPLPRQYTCPQFCSTASSDKYSLLQPLAYCSAAQCSQHHILTLFIVHYHSLLPYSHLTSPPTVSKAVCVSK